MNLDFLKQIGTQLANIWREIKIYQKFTVIVAALLLLGMLTFLVFNAASTRFTPLFPTERLMIADAAEIKGYLDGAGVAYRVRGDTTILVAEDGVHRLRMDLAAQGLPKMHSSKGFELFDTNTWIKGEKELQVLEMRALKGQLEQDIAEYENIRSANVILDISPPRPFGGSMYRAKSSTILNLMPGARLSQSQLRAITFHISGAVRGLTPNMVAISDTTGKLYQALDPDGDIDMVRSEEVALEERLKSKIDGMLGLVVGHGNFYSTIQVSMSREQMTSERKVFSGTVGGQALGDAVVASITEQGLQMTERERAELGTPGSNNEAVAGAIVAGGQEVLNRDENRTAQHRQMAVPMDHVKVRSVPGKINGISIAVLIDKTITVGSGSDLPKEAIADGQRHTEELREEIQSQLAKVLEGYGVSAVPAVDFVEFDKTKFNEKIANDSWATMIDTAVKTGSVLFIAVMVFGMFWTFNRFWKRHMVQPPILDTEEAEEELEFADEPTLVEVEAMVESIKMRFQSDPSAVVETVREWLNQEVLAQVGEEQ